MDPFLRLTLYDRFMHLLQNLVNNLISVGSGREAAFSAAVLGDNALMEKAWQETGMLAEAVLHSHVYNELTPHYFYGNIICTPIFVWTIQN